MWLAGEIGANRISCPGWSDPRLRAAWVNARWVGVPMPNIDPDKTASADMKYVEMGAQTLERVSRNFNGSSGKTNRAKLKREISELTKVPWSKNKDDEKKRKDNEEKEDEDA
jgi:capsid protein